MKKVVIFLLCMMMLLTGCGQTQSQNDTGNESDTSNEPIDSITELNLTNEVVPEYDSLDDEDLLSYVEDLVYRDTITSLNSDEYFVEDVSAIYISNEYLEEVAFNSQSNIYFGYTLAELDEIFQGTKYIFTLSDDGTTTVQELEEIEDDTTETMIKNVAIGTGVILICVTVSVVSAGTASAVSAIFAASATTAQNFAISSAAFGGISAGVVKGIETGDFNEAIKAAALGASEGFKRGAISGALVGGAKESFSLVSATKNGLTMNEAALIQSESNLPIDVISEMKSLEEYNIYKESGLKPMMVNGKTALVQNIDLDYVSQLPDGTEVNNLQRMQMRYAPIEPATNEPYQLHHIGQSSDGTLAVLTKSQHQGNYAILNTAGKESVIDRDAFKIIREEFWEYLGNYVFVNGGI